MYFCQRKCLLGEFNISEIETSKGQISRPINDQIYCLASWFEPDAHCNVGLCRPVYGLSMLNQPAGGGSLAWSSIWFLIAKQHKHKTIL